MNVLACDPYTLQERITHMGFKPCGLDELYSQSDFISLHCVLTEETRHMMDDKAFAKMKKGVYIINCARGGIIDEEALLRALESGRVAGVGLDVFEKEPPDPDCPLLKHPRCVATPHLGASTTEAQLNVAKAIAQQVIQALSGGEIKDAVNIPSVDPKVRAVLGPYLEIGEKLGMFGIQLLSRHAERVEMIYGGDLGEVDTSLLTLVILKGLLTPILEETVNYVNAPFLAEQRGIRYSETKTKDAEGFSSLVTVRLKSGEQALTMSGTNLAANDPRIVRVDGYHIDAKPTGWLLFLRNTDEPGVIGHVGMVLGRAGINIADLTLGRKERGESAVTVCNVDDQPSDEVLREIGSIPQILDVKMVNLR
jgi:D-3-phosphoglycerate dehydrogenase